MFMTYADLFAMLFASHLCTYARCSSADAAVRGAVREREREREWRALVHMCRA